VSLRMRRLVVGVAYHGVLVILCFAGIVLGEATGNPALSGLAALVLVGHALTFRLNPLGRMIHESLIGEADCPACGEVIDLVQIWTCSCGFVTWQPRHAFSLCPSCRRVLSWIVCPACETSIPM